MLDSGKRKMQIMYKIFWKFQNSEHYRLFQADVILLMTCAIREGAEQKIWKRLEQLKLRKLVRSKRNDQPPLKIGILGI